MKTSSLFHNPVLNFIKGVFLTAEVCYETACLWRYGNWHPLVSLRKIKRHKFRLTNNLISDILFLQTASLKIRCFLFIFIILVFILDFISVRKLVFLPLNVMYLKEIPCLNKVTLPYLTLHYWLMTFLLDCVHPPLISFWSFFVLFEMKRRLYTDFFRSHSKTIPERPFVHTWNAGRQDSKPMCSHTHPPKREKRAFIFLQGRVRLHVGYRISCSFSPVRQRGVRERYNVTSNRIIQ